MLMFDVDDVGGDGECDVLFFSTVQQIYLGLSRLYNPYHH